MFGVVQFSFILMGGMVRRVVDLFLWWAEVFGDYCVVFSCWECGYIAELIFAEGVHPFFIFTILEENP